MERYTQRELRRLISIGAALDLEEEHKKAEELGLYVIPGLSQIGYSSGTRGRNGGLLKGPDGILYACAHRSSVLSLYC